MLGDDRVVAGHPLAYDQVTGFGLVQALGELSLPPVPLGASSAAKLGSRVVMAGSGGRHHSIAARIVAKQEFAGYWEYVLDEAIFTAPAHPFWGGAALIDPQGLLLGVGSLQVEQTTSTGGESGQLNMVVPIDLLKPILGDHAVERPSQPAAACLARTFRHRSRGEGVRRRRLFRRAGGSRRPEAGRPHRIGRRRARLEPRRTFPQGVVARPGGNAQCRSSCSGKASGWRPASYRSERERFLKKPRMHS